MITLLGNQNKNGRAISDPAFALWQLDIDLFFKPLQSSKDRLMFPLPDPIAPLLFHSSARNWGTRSHSNPAKASITNAPKATVVGSPITSAMVPDRSAPNGNMPKKHRV